MTNKRKKLSVLVTVLIITFMVTLDGSIVNVALPTMASDLHTTMSGVEWVVTSYLIVVSATVLLFGKLGDMFGKARFFQMGVLLFSLGSLLSSLSSNLGFLIVSRVVQGIGASAALATNQGIISEAFPKEERGRALGGISASVALGTMIGPTAGGLIVSLFNWQTIFLINIPIGLVAFLLGLKTLPKRSSVKRQALDLPGSVLMLLSVLFIFCPLTLLQNQRSIFLVILLLVGVVLLVLFVWVEKKSKNPLVELSVFKNAAFTANLVSIFIGFICIGSVNIILPFYLQDAMKFSTLMAGFLLTVSPLTMAVVGPLSGALCDRWGYRHLLPCCFLLFTVGTAMALLLNTTTPIWMIIVILFVAAIGNAAVQPLNNTLLMSSVAQEHYGFAGSLGALMRNVGMTAGVTLSTTLLYNRMSAKIGYRVSDYVAGRDDVFIYGLHWVYGMLAALLLFAAVLLFVVLILKNKDADSHA